MSPVIDVKTLDEDELRASNSVFRAAMHYGPGEDQAWERASRSYQPGRAFGAYVGGTLAGTTMSMAMPMTVPGGAVLPSAAVTRVGVRADHTRRGVLTAVMREQLAATREPIASLRASEYPIYGRFGYGVATRGRTVEIEPGRGRFHAAAPASGQVRLVDRDDAQKAIPELYRTIVGRLRPGALHRSEPWWEMMFNRPGNDEHPLVAIVHTGPDGDDGFATYRAERNATPEDQWGLALVLDDLHATSVAATAALWRFVLGVDLTNLVRGWLRPLDEPLELLLADARACRTREVSDEAWLRLVDVPAALSARSWAGQDAVVLNVRDTVLPANSGAYRITPDGIARTDDEPQLDCDVAALARLYLGDLAPSALAATGWLTVHAPAALPAADALFATATVPWSGTFF
jgi:predicted acetyltransferase